MGHSLTLTLNQFTHENRHFHWNLFYDFSF